MAPASPARPASAGYPPFLESARWTVQITYASRAGERCEVLERQRGGVRGFATLDAVARCLAGLGLTVFRVNACGLAGEEPP